MSQSLYVLPKDCPNCGQSGLQFVRLLTMNGQEAILCSDCEAIWFGKRITYGKITTLSDLEEQYGMRFDWAKDIEVQDYPS